MTLAHLSLLLSLISLGVSIWVAARATFAREQAWSNLLWSEMAAGCWYQDHTPLQLEARR